MCAVKEILLKSWKKTSQSEPHPSPRPRDPWKSWKKPHNLRTIPWTSGNPGKNLTICGPSPGPPEILEKNLTILGICLLLVVGCWLFRQAVQRPPAGANISLHIFSSQESAARKRCQRRPPQRCACFWRPHARRCRKNRIRSRLRRAA